MNKERARKRNPDERRKATLRHKYGIDLNQYNDLFKKQNGCCAICGRHQIEFKKKRLHVDHNHTTKKVRALLCNNCNLLIGHSKENIDILKLAIDYLNLYAGY